MISLVVTIDGDTKNYNLVARDKEFSDILATLKEPFEIIYTACTDYGFLGELRNIVSTQKNKHLIVFAPTTNINTQIYAALDYTDNGDVLLCTLDTNTEVLKNILKKHFDGADLVFVKHKEKWYKAFFTALGRGTYQLGLKILGRGQDLCCDARVVYLNTRSVNTIILNPSLSKALRLVNPDPEKTTRVVSEPKVYDNPTSEQQKINKSFFSLGIVALIYLIALVGMALVFPFFNEGLYTGWILLAIVIWLILGVVACAIVGKTIYNTRLGYPITLNLQGQPVINIEAYYSYNSELARKFADEEDTNEIGEDEIPQSKNNSLSKLREEASGLEQDENQEKGNETESKKEENDTSNKAQEKNENNNEANEVKAEKVTENETTTEPESENDKIAEEKATEQVEASPTKEQAEKTTKSKTAKSTTKASATKKTSSAKKTATKKKSTTSKASMITKISGKKTAKTKK